MQQEHCCSTVWHVKEVSTRISRGKALTAQAWAGTFKPNRYRPLQIFMCKYYYIFKINYTH